MALPYSPQTWTNGSAGGTPLSAGRLDHIEDGLVDLSDFLVTGSAWTTYVPSWTNVNVTGATVEAAYFQIGKFVAVRIRAVLGTATPISGSVIASLPVTASSSGSVSVQTTMGAGVFRDVSAGTTVPVSVRFQSTTTASFAPTDGTTTYGAYVAASSTIPFTWATGDIIDGRFWYEAA